MGKVNDTMNKEYFMLAVINDRLVDIAEKLDTLIDLLLEEKTRRKKENTPSMTLELFDYME